MRGARWKASIKLLPDPAPGARPAWRGSLAVSSARPWGRAARAMGIKSMEDLRRVMHAQLTPLGQGIKETDSPIGMRREREDGTERGPMRTVDTQFSKGVKPRVPRRRVSRASCECPPVEDRALCSAAAIASEAERVRRSYLRAPTLASLSRAEVLERRWDVGGLVFKRRGRRRCAPSPVVLRWLRKGRLRR